MAFFDRFRFKALSESEMRHPRRPLIWFDFQRPGDDKMRRDIGDATAMNIVLTPIRWIQRSFHEADLVIDTDGVLDAEHELVKLINKPNKFYSGEHLFSATLLSLAVDGNGYWICVRNGRGKVIQLWYTPHTMMEPKFPDDGSEYITHYEYTVGGTKQRIEIEDVIHFRDGLDPNNIRKGLSPLGSLVREIWSDHEASLFSAALLLNNGVPGLVLSPKEDVGFSMEEAEATKDYIEDKFTGSNRGKTIVMTGPTEVTQFGFNPRQLDMSGLRNISEERVCASLGVPAAIVGFGTGMQQTKVGATMKELRKLGWHNGIIPLQRVIASELNNRLAEPFRLTGKVAFDNSDVSALVEDETERIGRITSLVSAAVWTRGEGREATGQEVTPADDIFLQSFNMIEVPRSGRQIIPDAKAYELKESHSPLELRIASEAPRRQPPTVILRLGKQLDAIRKNLPAAMEADLLSFFLNLGDLAFDAALPVVKESVSIDADQILEGMAMDKQLAIFALVFERAYVNVGEETNRVITAAFDLRTGIPDPLARSIVAAGGTRAGLIDITAQTRQRLFDALTEGRALGKAGEGLARFIRDEVPKGPWSTAATRARIIARTETAFAVNVASVVRARDMDVSRMMILDNRAGFDDEVCSAMNGRVVTVQEAQELAALEHPNGTRNMSPMPDALLAELDLGPGVP